MLDPIAYILAGLDPSRVQAGVQNEPSVLLAALGGQPSLSMEHFNVGQRPVVKPWQWSPYGELAASATLPVPGRSDDLARRAAGTRNARPGGAQRPSGNPGRPVGPGWI